MRPRSPAVVWASLAVSNAASVNSPDAFYSALRPCPAGCDGTPSNWTVYPSVDRLKICEQPMLLDFAIYNPLDDPTTTVRLRTCTSGNANDMQNGLLAASTSSSKRSSVSNSSTCVSANESKVSLDLFVSGNTGSSSKGELQTVLSQLQQYLANPTYCETTFLVGYNNGSVAAVYSGASIDNSQTVPSILEQVLTYVGTGDAPAPETLTAQLCDETRNANYIFGVAVSATGDLGAVQQAVQTWSNGTCVSSTSQAAQQLTNISVYEAPLIPVIAASNQTVVSNSTRLQARGDCTAIMVVSGDSCASLATQCGITANQFLTYNPSSSLCSSLAVGERVCCTSGTLPDIAPKPSPNGACATYTVKTGDTCAAIAATNGITSTQLESFNDKTVWGWNGCSNLDAGVNICLSTGNPPLPAPMANALCGPSVPGTAAPTSGQNISTLNPCPLNSCCDIWGQCGTTPDFCTASTGSTGNPGTAPPGKNGCISNCGTSVVNNASPPSSIFRVAYYESFNWDRPCLNYRAFDLGATNYTHAHWAFATVNSDFSVGINDSYTQLPDFLQLPLKRIVSFGGWGYSTDPATYNLLRDAMDAGNVDKFVTNIINFLNSQGFDGVDIDWEYPGAPDIPGIPPGLATDGPNYLAFLQKLRAALPSGKTMSIAAPASYWYLKAFPVAQMAEELDYIVFMTYDLHGQWDYNSPWSQDGCPAGDCLRSHVNLTETEYSLAMLTKAGVQANKIVVGVSSYGRSFGMVDTAACESSITDASCIFGGPDSTAEPGICTETAGYIANAEINEIIGMNETGTIYKFDSSSNSDTLIYNSTWVAYMSDATKSSRTSYYQGLNFLGTVDWAVDLQEFTGDDGDASDDEDEDVPAPDPLTPCTKTYSSLDALNADAANIPDHCVTFYTVTVLNNLLQQGISNYSNLMNSGYDSKFSTYANSVASTASTSLTSFVNNNGNKYFSCIVPEASVCCSYCDANKLTSSYCDYCFSSGSCYQTVGKRESISPQQKLVMKVVNESEPCPPDYSKRGYGPNNPYIQSIYWTLTNSSGFYADLDASTGISKNYTKIGNYDRGNDCSPGAKSSDTCWSSGMDFDFPLINGYSASDVANPKDIVSQALSKVQNLSPQLDSILTDLSLDAYDGDGAELIDAISLPILMIAAATEQMADVVSVAKQITEEEEKAAIMAFLSAIFFIVPIVGEVVGSIAELADVSAILNLLGAVGNSALDIYQIVDDPSNAPLAIFDLILEPLALGDLNKIGEASDLRRGMAADDVSKLGDTVEDRLSTIDNIKGTCVADPA